jgi:hypothetical protein
LDLLITPGAAGDLLNLVGSERFPVNGNTEGYPVIHGLKFMQE